MEKKVLQYKAQESCCSWPPGWLRCGALIVNINHWLIIYQKFKQIYVNQALLSYNQSMAKWSLQTVALPAQFWAPPQKNQPKLNQPQTLNTEKKKLRYCNYFALQHRSVKKNRIFPRTSQVSMSDFSSKMHFCRKCKNSSGKIMEANLTGDQFFQL